MPFSAKVIEHSVSEEGIEILSMQLRYPRFVHAEFMTHRMFSRNASSSRAIPVERMIEEILQHPAMPIHWGKNQKGMQAENECSELVGSLTREEAWLMARDDAVKHARAFSAAGYHKQIVNRLLEPFMHINVIVTSTSWENFFTLRLHKDAQPEIRCLAEMMKAAKSASTPSLVKYGDWHLPYITVEERLNLNVETLKKISVARCARVSYMTHDGKTPSVEKDLELYDRLVGSVPLHASPAEHQATPDRIGSFGWNDSTKHGNFLGWCQLRKFLPNEYVAEENTFERSQRRWDKEECQG